MNFLKNVIVFSALICPVVSMAETCPDPSNLRLDQIPQGYKLADISPSNYYSADITFSTLSIYIYIQDGYPAMDEGHPGNFYPQIFKPTNKESWGDETIWSFACIYSGGGGTQSITLQKIDAEQKWFSFDHPEYFRIPSSTGVGHKDLAQLQCSKRLVAKDVGKNYDISACGFHEVPPPTSQ